MPLKRWDESNNHTEGNSDQGPPRSSRMVAAFVTHDAVSILGNDDSVNWVEKMQIFWSFGNYQGFGNYKPSPTGYYLFHPYTTAIQNLKAPLTRI